MVVLKTDTKLSTKHRAVETKRKPAYRDRNKTILLPLQTDSMCLHKHHTLMTNQCIISVKATASLQRTLYKASLPSRRLYT